MPAAEDRPVVACCGGSGITPVISIAKHVLATSDRSVRLLYANRDAESVIFGETEVADFLSDTAARIDELAAGN